MVLCLVAFVVLMALCAPAFAYQEPNTLTGNATNGCLYCHPFPIAAHPAQGGVCADCHADGPLSDGYTFNSWQGPHSGYSSTTYKCGVCHIIHDAPSESIVLLPEPTIVSTCFTCHDGTGGWGVYGAVKARTGSGPAGGHSYEQTSVVPGGSAATGGSSTMLFGGPGGTLICTDCHSPHGSAVVAAFKGDRRRVRGSAASALSNRLLKQKPAGVATAVAEYGSDWCLACHAGRSSGGTVHNHPVDSLLSTATPFIYRNVAILASEVATSVTQFGPLGGVPFTAIPPGSHWVNEPNASGNRGFLMPYPRTTGASGQSGHAPICQQCHEDTRDVGELTGDGSVGDAAPATIALSDGVVWNSGTSTWTASADNPLLQNFPHETLNTNMLVETGDNLCLNCHPVSQLP